MNYWINGTIGLMDWINRLSDQWTNDGLSD